MFCWYVRNTYLENKLREPGATVQCGQPVDLGAVDVPAFVYASKEDHIVPWQTAYASTQLLSGDTTFVLGASGHIAGVINPPAKKKRNYWTAATAAPDAPTSARLEADPDRWFEAAEQVPGSWWPAWAAWLAPHSGPQVAARKKLGNAEFTRDRGRRPAATCRRRRPDRPGTRSGPGAQETVAQEAVQPPSITNEVPVIDAAAGEHR